MLKKQLFLFRLFFFCFFFILAMPLSANQAKEIMRKQEETKKGYQDEHILGQLNIINKRDVVIKRRYQSYALEGEDQKRKSLIKILSPVDLKGVGLLSHQKKEGEDAQWLYLPALQKVKRISGAAKQGRFIGSDFTYEDLMPRNLDRYSYAYLRQEDFAGQSCHVIELTPEDKNSLYTKIISWVSKKNHQTLKSDLYDKKKTLFKQTFFEQFKKIEGRFWYAHQITMHDLKRKRRSVIKIEAVRLAQGLAAHQFTTSALKR